MKEESLAVSLMKLVVVIGLVIGLAIVMGFAAQYVFAQFGFVFGFWKAWWIMVLIRFMIGSTASGTHNVSETLKKWRKKEND